MANRHMAQWRIPYSDKCYIFTVRKKLLTVILWIDTHHLLLPDQNQKPDMICNLQIYAIVPFALCMLNLLILSTLWLTNVVYKHDYDSFKEDGILKHNNENLGTVELIDEHISSSKIPMNDSHTFQFSHTTWYLKS